MFTRWNSNKNYSIKPVSLVRWKVNFVEEKNKNKKVIEKLLPLDIMKLTSSDLTKQFTVAPGEEEYTSRELVFRFYESDYCKVFNLTGSHPILLIKELLSELPPVYIFHSELDLVSEGFPDLTGLDVLNAIYCIDINNYMYNKTLFRDNLYKVVESNLQFYWME